MAMMETVILAVENAPTTAIMGEALCCSQYETMVLNAISS